MMMLIRKPIFLFVLFILCLVVGCSDEGEIKSTGAESDSTQAVTIRPDSQIRGARIGLFDGSVKTTDIRADYIEKYTKQDSTLAWGLKVYFFDSEGKETSNLVADSGLIRESIKWMVANGNVVVMTEDSSRLETEQLFWNGRTEMITTDSFVTIYQVGDTLMGYGMEADQGLKRVIIKKRVSGAFQNVEELEE